MMETKYKIGDRVKILPSNEFGIIGDIMFSYKHKANLYEVYSDDDADVFLGKFIASDLADAPKAREFSMDIKIDIAQNVVIAMLYESVGGGAETLETRTRSHHSRWRNRYRTSSELCLQTALREPLGNQRKGRNSA